MFKNKKIMILVLASVMVVAMAGTAFATEYWIGNGICQIGVYKHNGLPKTHTVYGLDTRAQVTTYIMDSNYAGWRGTLDTYKALALYNQTPLVYDRVRFHSFRDSNELRLDPSYTSNYVGDNYNKSARYVDTVQRALYYLGYLNYSDIDGIWGPTTKAAVSSFQNNNYGLARDGIVGYETWSRLASYGS